MSAPRVLVVATVLGLGPSGVQRQAAQILPRAAARLGTLGGELVLLEGAVPLPGIEGVARKSCGVPPGPAHKRFFAERRAIVAALEEARRDGRPFQLVHQGHQPFATGAVRRAGAVPVWLVHDLRRLHQGALPQRAFASWAMARTARQAGAVLVVSESVRDALAQRFPALRGRLHVVPNAADHGQSAGPRAPNSKPYLLGVGHLEPRKSWDTAIAAVALDPSLPPLLVVGGTHGRAGHRERRRLQQIAEAPACAGRVRFLGAVPDSALAELYRGAAAVVVPSRLEGFSLPALEALAAGVPLVASDIAVHREVAGDAAWYFPCGDASACARACAAALSAPEQRAAAARARAAHYSWDNSADGLVDAWLAAARELR